MRLFLHSAGRYLQLAGRSFVPGRDNRLSLRRIAVMLAFLPLLGLVQLIHWIGFLLDEVLFRGYRSVEVREPLFVLGVPRSGTTFVHRVLARDEQFTTFSTWECLFGLSVTARKFWAGVAALDRRIGAPLNRALRALESRALGRLEDIHATGLAAAEEDYFALMPLMACFILVLPFPFAGTLWRVGAFDRDLPADERRRIMSFYRRALQRHLYFHGADKRLLSKNASFASLVGSLRETFPDARIICCMRDPLETVPSQLSSVESGMRLFGNDPRDPVFRERMIALMEFYYANLLHRLGDAPDSRAALVSMERLKEDLQHSLSELYRRFGIPLSAEFEAVLAEEAEKARAYVTGHRYRLSDLQLDPESLRSRFAHVYSRFSFPSRAPAEGSAAGRRPADGGTYRRGEMAC